MLCYLLGPSSLLIVTAIFVTCFNDDMLERKLLKFSCQGVDAD